MFTIKHPQSRMCGTHLTMSEGRGRIPAFHRTPPLILHTAPHVHHHHYTSSPALQVTLVRLGVRGHQRRSFQHHLLSTCLTIREDPASQHTRPRRLMCPLPPIAIQPQRTPRAESVRHPKSQTHRKLYAHHFNPSHLPPLLSSRAGCQPQLRRR